MPPTADVSSKLKHTSSSKQSKVFSARGRDNKTVQCSLCKEEEHHIHQCSTFKSWDVEKRRQHVSNNKLCFNCLGSGHRSRDCNSNGRCHECSSAHHTLLHAPSVPTLPAPTETAQINLVQDSSFTFKKSVLRTALVNVSTGNTSQAAKVFFDEGAEISLISSKLARTLDAKLVPYHLQVNGIGPTPIDCKYVTTVEISFVNPNEHKPIPVSCHVVDNSLFVNTGADAKELRRQMTERNLKPWADIQLGEKAKVDLLLCGQDSNRCYIGPDYYSAGKDLHFINTVFGWTVGGGIPATGHHAIALKTTSTSDESAYQLFSLLWDLQTVPEEGPLSPEEQSAVTQYQDSYTRLPSGQYSVSLSRCSPVPELRESRPAALKRFLQNERSLERKGQWEAFDAVLHEYTTLGHAERVPFCDLFKPSSEHFYLPMHGVVKDSSTTTKLRVFFDASAKTTSGFSLNDQLLAGPSLYPNLSTVISKFR